MHDKPDTIRLQPPEVHYYAELIDGEWWWVNGCAECNGRARDWMTYVECKKHNVCRVCAISRDETENAWGGKNGWCCDPCHTAEHEADKSAALAAMPKDFYEYDYHDKYEITCPYCAYEFSDSWECSEYEDEDKDCPRCDNVFEVTAVQSLTFNCNRK